MTLPVAPRTCSAHPVQIQSVASNAGTSPKEKFRQFRTATLATLVFAHMPRQTDAVKGTSHRSPQGSSSDRSRDNTPRQPPGCRTPNPRQYVRRHAINQQSKRPPTVPRTSRYYGGSYSTRFHTDLEIRASPRRVSAFFSSVMHAHHARVATLPLIPTETRSHEDSRRSKTQGSSHNRFHVKREHVANSDLQAHRGSMSKLREPMLLQGHMKCRFTWKSGLRRQNRTRQDRVSEPNMHYPTSLRIHRIPRENLRRSCYLCSYPAVLSRRHT